MEADKIDRRTRKTRSAIQTAFIKLILKKDISKITVREISELADINRATFYLHYSDVYQVLESIEDGIAAGFLTIIDKYDMKALAINPYPLLDSLTSELSDRPEISRFIMSSETNSNFVKKIKERLKTKLHDAYGAEDGSRMFYVIAFAISGTLDTYELWYNNGKQVPLQDLSMWISALLSKGVSALLPSKD